MIAWLTRASENREELVSVDSIDDAVELGGGNPVILSRVTADEARYDASSDFNYPYLGWVFRHHAHHPAPGDIHIQVYDDYIE